MNEEELWTTIEELADRVEELEQENADPERKSKNGRRLTDGKTPPEAHLAFETRMFNCLVERFFVQLE